MGLVLGFLAFPEAFFPLAAAAMGAEEVAAISAIVESKTQLENLKTTFLRSLSFLFSSHQTSRPNRNTNMGFFFSTQVVSVLAVFGSEFMLGYDS